MKFTFISNCNLVNFIECILRGYVDIEHRLTLRQHSVGTRM